MEFLVLRALLSTNKGSPKISRLCLISKKVLRKEKKKVLKENNFLTFDFTIEKYKKIKYNYN